MLPWLLLVLLWSMAVPVHAQDTYFLDDNENWSSQGDKEYQNFTISNASQAFEFRFVSDFTALAAIINNSDIQAFYDGANVSTYTVFNHNFGVHFVTLPPGNYSVVTRNDTDGSNTARYELDKPIDFSSNSKLYDHYIAGNKYVGANGGQLTQPFTIQSGYRYWLDGCNTGVEVYVIAASELSNFTNNRSFKYYPDYSSASASTDEPGGYELKLDPGDYYLVARNPASNDKAIQYNSSRWILNNSGGGTGGGGTGGSGGTGTIDLSGSVGYSISGGTITLKAGTLSNTTSGRSGSLRLRVYATRARYAGGTITGYILGTYNLKPLPANSHYSKLAGNVNYKKPPSGTFYTTMTAEEFTSSGWVIRDYSTFKSTRPFLGPAGARAALLRAAH